jgi:hypothetical protein
MKTTLNTFFDIKGTVHFEFIPQGQSTKLIRRKYRSVYMKLCVKKGLNVGPTIGFLTVTLLQLASKMIFVKQFLAQKLITEMETPTYSPSLAPNDSWLFPEIKSALKGRTFQDNENIK